MAGALCLGAHNVLGGTNGKDPTQSLPFCYLFLDWTIQGQFWVFYSSNCQIHRKRVSSLTLDACFVFSIVLLVLKILSSVFPDRVISNARRLLQTFISVRTYRLSVWDLSLGTKNCRRIFCSGSLCFPFLCQSTVSTLWLGFCKFLLITSIRVNQFVLKVFQVPTGSLKSLALAGWIDGQHPYREADRKSYQVRPQKSNLMKACYIQIPENQKMFGSTSQTKKKPRSAKWKRTPDVGRSNQRAQESSPSSCNTSFNSVPPNMISIKKQTIRKGHRKKKQ